MATIAYLHDGTSVYDELFIDHLVEKNTVYFLTFNRKPKIVPRKARLVTLHGPFVLFSSKQQTEGFRMYLLAFLRALILGLYLRWIKPDIVLGCMATKYGFYSALLGYRPLVLIVWGSDILLAPKRFLLFRFMAKYSLKKADAVILDSEVQREAAVELGCTHDKIFKFPWFDPAEISPILPRAKVREKLGWDNNKIIVSSRSHQPLYRIEDLVEAIPQIVSKSPQSRFLIIGEGLLTESLKKRVKELGVRRYVKFTGFLPKNEVITYVNASDIYVSTSLSDGTSASLLEAMALGVPAVVTEIPGNKEWIENGYNGYLVPVNSPQSLSERVIHLVENKRHAEKIGENARGTVETQVNWHKNMEILNNLILQLAEQRSDR